MACQTCAGRNKAKCPECGPGPTRPTAAEIAQAQGVVDQFEKDRRDEFAKIILNKLMANNGVLMQLWGGGLTLAGAIAKITDNVIDALDNPSAPDGEEDSKSSK